MDYVTGLLNNCTTVNEVVSLVQTNDSVRNCKVQCIKRIRELSMLGLKESKDIFDAAFANDYYVWEGVQPLIREIRVEVERTPSHIVANVRKQAQGWRDTIDSVVKEMESVTRLLRNNGADGNWYSDEPQSPAYDALIRALRDAREVGYTLGDVAYNSFDIDKQG